MSTRLAAKTRVRINTLSDRAHDLLSNRERGLELIVVAVLAAIFLAGAIGLAAVIMSAVNARTDQIK